VKVVFEGSSVAQVRWGENDDPSNLLVVGQEYEVTDEEVHDWHTKYTLKCLPNKKFNSSSFNPSRILSGWNEYHEN